MGLEKAPLTPMLLVDFLLLMFRLSVSGPPTQHDETGQGSASDANIASDCTSQSFQLEIKLQSQAVSWWFVFGGYTQMVSW